MFSEGNKPFAVTNRAKVKKPLKKAILLNVKFPRFLEKVQFGFSGNSLVGFSGFDSRNFFLGGFMVDPIIRDCGSGWMPFICAAILFLGTWISSRFRPNNKGWK